MAKASIHPATNIGYVHLTVANLDRSLVFYQDNLGFQLHRREGDTAYLGAGGPDLLVLTERPDARPVSGVTGLYHFAILTPSRVALAQSLRHLAETRTPVQGFSDHWVSEAIYLADPDGNGIEIYRDRPRSEWPRQNGQLQMATDPLDLQSILAELEAQPAPWTGLEPETVIGHVHLHIATIPSAEAFYVGTLGFDLIMRYGPSASFVSADGYHHHLGLNTWAGVNAPPPPPDAAGLRYFTLNLPDSAALAAVVERIQQTGLAFQEKDGVVFLRDPAQNGVVLATGQEAGTIVAVEIARS
ncbi:MAG: VOC family protein [Anaerolineales bacterium]|nr:VOC family protein [Anaerolineales bacterium]